nr:hypothetical protein [Tanacetum cinerariifolium]
MNYVPVDAGTISTNLSGTKDTASQEVKKDVSSLRYIALPNWAHDALLEFSSSKPQDNCSTEVPEGSGNSNPTASTPNPTADHIETLTVETPIPTVSSPVPTAFSTDSQEPLSDARLISKRVTNQEETPSLDNILSLTNRLKTFLEAHDALLESTSSKPYKESSSQVPEGSGNPNPTDSTFNLSAKQIETLTVESPIPTVSSPVPTTCVNDSSEPSSEARLVSKRVANQEETPSLDNILSLTNRFEDILRVSTSSDEIIGVEADVSNMETSISASPTPTLRIHKDHPKS